MADSEASEERCKFHEYTSKRGGARRLRKAPVAAPRGPLCQCKLSSAKVTLDFDNASWCHCQRPSLTSPKSSHVPLW